MRQQRLRRFLFVIPIVLLALISLPTAASAGPDHRTVKAFDDCDPASFNAIVGPGTCVGDGRTTFPDFAGQLTDNGSAEGWDFSRPDFDIDKFGRITVNNLGGEFHTFTEVAAFGGGCVPPVNALLGLTPVPECDPLAPDGVTPLAFVTTGMAPLNGTLNVDRTLLTPGVHKFQCLVHPWMQSVVDVED